MQSATQFSLICTSADADDCCNEMHINRRQNALGTHASGHGGDGTSDQNVRSLLINDVAYESVIRERCIKEHALTAGGSAAAEAGAAKWNAYYTPTDYSTPCNIS